MKLHLQKFIEDNPDNWKQVIQEKPYCITVKEDDDYILLSYSQIDSDFSNPVVKECRGIILRKSDYQPVCYPFRKFFNVQEPLADNIDWNSASVQEKVDGSILKCFYDNGEWHVATNGTIDARNAELMTQTQDIKNYYDLFVAAVEENYCPIDEFLDKLHPNYTWMFELVSPLNKIVVPYPNHDIYHIGTRNIFTYQEVAVDIGIKQPKRYPLSTIEECLDAAESMPFNEEGFVVVDKNWHRVKIKSPAYVAVHHLRGNGIVNRERALDLILVGEQEEFLGYYPEYEDLFFDLNDGLLTVKNIIESQWDEHPVTETRKEFAMWANQTMLPSCMYSLLDGRYDSPEHWLYAQPSEKILKWIDAL